MARISKTFLLKLLILIGLCFGFAFLLVHDIIWYAGLLDVRYSEIESAIVGVILSILSIVVFLYLQVIRKTQKHRQYALMASVLIAVIAYSLLLGSLPVRDLNDVYRIERNTADGLLLRDGNGHLVLDISGSGNVSSGDTPRIYVRFNGTLVQNFTQIDLWYYNGTADNRSATPPFYSNGYPNWARWTDRLTQIRQSFGNMSENGMFYLSFPIPSQKANTTVEYLFLFHQENATGTVYSHYGGFSYTVQYSESQNMDTTDYIRTAHLFIAAIIILSGLNILFSQSDSSKEKGSDFAALRIEFERRGLIKKPEGDTYPLTKDLVERSDRLAEVRNDIRNTAGFFLATIAAFVLYLQENPLFNFSIPFFMMGLYSGIFFSLSSIVLSVSSPKTADLNNSIQDGLLPPTSSLEDLRFLICLRIEEQETIIRRSRALFQMGIAAIATGFLADLFVDYLPRSALVFGRPTLYLGFILSVLLVFVLLLQVVKYYLEIIGYVMMME